MKLLYILCLCISVCACKEIPPENLTPTKCIRELKIDIEEGQTKTYFKNKKIETAGLYKRGLRHGFWKFYYENGKLKTEGNYTKGVKDGFWKTYYVAGGVKTEGHYANCEPSGYWKFYDVQNNFIRDDNY